MGRLPATTIFLLIFAVTFLYPPSAPAGQSERAREILEKVDDLWRGESSHGILEMRVKTAHYTRNLTMEVWSKGEEKSLVRIVEPLKEQGMATLKDGPTVYTYLPKTDRTIKLTSGMMMGSWMGSHFTNDDLVKESRLADDYLPDITFEGERKGKEVVEITLIPKPEAPVVWGKITVTIQTRGLLPVSEIFYDEEMEMVRTIEFSDVKNIGGRTMPALLKVQPMDKPDEYTELEYLQMKFGIDIKQEFFSVTSLRKW